MMTKYSIQILKKANEISLTDHHDDGGKSQKKKKNQDIEIYKSNDHNLNVIVIKIHMTLIF